jgi:hypothetical protein
MGALSVQVFQEFHVQATRTTRTRPLPHQTAVGLLTAWTEDMSHGRAVEGVTVVNPFR